MAKIQVSEKGYDAVLKCKLGRRSTRNMRFWTPERISPKIGTATHRGRQHLQITFFKMLWPFTMRSSFFNGHSALLRDHRHPSRSERYAGDCYVMTWASCFHCVSQCVHGRRTSFQLLSSAQTFLLPFVTQGTLPFLAPNLVKPNRDGEELSSRGKRKHKPVTEPLVETSWPVLKVELRRAVKPRPGKEEPHCSKHLRMMQPEEPR